eukprot:scaffold32637_cov61-Phaeocystis_antarctica.AAC.4
MSGALHNAEAPNAHERLQPVELLPHALREAAQDLHRIEEGHAAADVGERFDDLLECVVR